MRVSEEFSIQQIGLILILLGSVIIGTAGMVGGSAHEIRQNPDTSFVSQETKTDHQVASNVTTLPQNLSERQIAKSVPVQQFNYTNLSTSRQFVIEQSLTTNNSTAITTLEQFPSAFIVSKGRQKYQFNSQPAQRSQSIATVSGIGLIILGLVLILSDSRLNRPFKAGTDITKSTGNSQWVYDADDDE
ncbi:hypothetical protein [environmental halophage 1 AAJ-2005]|nr:hypothetical protein [environmental halophage 1 AAJ-2005]